MHQAIFVGLVFVVDFKHSVLSVVKWPMCTSIHKQEAQQLLGWPTVLPHKLNPNLKPITN